MFQKAIRLALIDHMALMMLINNNMLMKAAKRFKINKSRKWKKGKKAIVLYDDINKIYPSF